MSNLYHMIKIKKTIYYKIKKIRPIILTGLHLAN